MAIKLIKYLLEVKEMIIDELIKNFKDKNITVNKKREDVFQQECKETYVSKKRKKKKKK